MPWRIRAAFAGVSTVLVTAVVGSAVAEPLMSTVSFDARYAAATDALEPADQAPIRTAAAVRDHGPEDPGSTEPGRAASLDARTRYRALIEKEAARHALSPDIAEAVMAAESGFNAGAVGSSGEIGLMQILPSTARMLGFAGSLADLAEPETNIRYGVTYLAQAWRLAGGDLCTAAMKYRAGHGETRFSFLSVNYCVAVRSKLAARGFPITGSVPVATFGEPARACDRKCTHVSSIGSVNIAALNTRLSALVVQVRGGR
ncbi:MAG TPA: transglycosylase SLT domain-containing protein [Rhodopseudomonas sp.]|uniref:lytic transglycosylase domain-containing protein n=1 Tax=Rhodopseudomonas sp. TaxID=1078 RepID=UPI002EDB9553